MPGPLTRDEIARDRFTLPQAVQREIEELRHSGELGDGTKTEPRCYVCCEAESKKLVNKLLAAGLTNREIAESCEFINKRRQAVGDDRLIDARGVWYHNREHFKLDDPVRAVYRSITERHAEQANIDHINGIGTGVSPYAVLHVAMVKGFADIAAGNTPVSVRDTMAAATKLHEFTTADAGQKKVADMMNMMDRIITAAQYFVPQDKYEDFLTMVEGRVEAPMAALTEKVHETAQAAVREFAPHSTRDDEEL